MGPLQAFLMLYLQMVIVIVIITVSVVAVLIVLNFLFNALYFVFSKLGNIIYKTFNQTPAEAMISYARSIDNEYGEHVYRVTQSLHHSFYSWAPEIRRRNLVMKHSQLAPKKSLRLSDEQLSKMKGYTDAYILSFIKS